MPFRPVAARVTFHPSPAQSGDVLVSGSTRSTQESAVRVKLLIFGVLVPPILVLDWVTKRWALEALAAQRGELFGGLVPLTLAFNKGAAFGLSVGEDSRWFFVPVTFLALGLLVYLMRDAEEGDHTRITAIALVVAGALGNLYDRLRWDRGVVDFLGPIDLGLWDFPIFNVADMSITCGAILLAVSFWMEEQRIAARAQTEEGQGPPGETGEGGGQGEPTTG